MARARRSLIHVHACSGVLADLYRPQQLLTSGAIRTSSCSAIPPSCALPDIARRGFIQFFATDLARGPDGAWRVIVRGDAGRHRLCARQPRCTNVAGTCSPAMLRLAPSSSSCGALARRADRADPASLSSLQAAPQLLQPPASPTTSA
jgi:hypothetical protein